MPTTQTGIATDFISFSRASLATVTDSDGKIKWAPHNLLSFSENFENAAWWATSQATILSNRTTAPNGTVTADIVVDNVSGNPHFVAQSVGIVSGTKYSVVVYAKLKERSRIYLGLDNGATATEYAYSFFDLASAGAVGAQATVGGWVVSGTPTITPVANGFFRCQVDIITDSTLSARFIVGPATTDGVFSYTGDGTSGVFVWGAHLYRSDLGGMQNNPSAFPTYNPTSVKNLFSFSENFDNAGWVKVGGGVTVQTNAITAPNGLVSAEKIVASSSSTSKEMYSPGATTVIGGTYTASVYAKAAGLNWVYIVCNVNTSLNGTFFNLATGEIGNTVGTGSTPAIAPVGDGWFRVASTRTATYATGYIEIFPAQGNGTSAPSFTGDNVSGIYLWGAQLSDSASLDPYVPNYGAAPTSAAYHGPRRDFDATGSCKGLLVEEQRTNLILNSNNLAGTGWVGGKYKAQTSILAPDGTMVANVATVFTGSTQIYQNVAAPAGAYTSAGYFKYHGTAQWLYFQLTDGNNGYRVWFNLQTGEKGQNASFGTGASGLYYNSISVGNGWFRFILSGVIPGANKEFLFVPVRADGGTATTADDGVYLYGAQLENGSFATSYIPTGASQVTRSADLANVNVQAFPYSTGQGALVASIMPNAFTSSGHPSAVLSDAAFANLALVGQIISTTVIRAGAIDVGGVNQAIFPVTTSMSAGLTLTSGMAYAQNDVAASLNGATALTDNSANMPSGATELFIGRLSGQYFNGHIRQITYLPRRISNADLQTRTA